LCDIRPKRCIFRARTFVDANVKLEPSQWHEGSFAVEDRFARDLADLLTEEGFDVSDGRTTLEGV